MRPSLANGVQAWSIEEERLEIVSGACAATGPLAHIADTTPARSHAAVRISGLLQMGFRATNQRIASSLPWTLPTDRAFFLLRLPHDTRGVELRRDARTALSTEVAFAAAPPQ